MLNPYATNLGDRNPLEVIEATPAHLQSLLDRMSPARVNQALAPGKWSPREILCHLADAEVAFAFRLRQTLAEDHHVIQPFDQDKWSPAYTAYDAASAMAVFSSLRHWNVALIRSSGPAAMQKKVLHPERGEMTFATIVETMAGHDLNHLRQLDTTPAA